MSLHFEDTRIVSRFNEPIDDGRHSTYYGILKEKFVHDIHFQRGKRRYGYKMLQQVLDLFVFVAFCPKKFLEIKGVHGVIGFVADTV